MKRALAALVVLASLGACSSGGEASSEPTPAFEAPAGIELAEPGTDHKIGSGVTIAHPDLQGEAGTALGLGGGSLTKAPRRDLALFSIPEGMQPYYATVMVANRGPAPASFPEGAPWWLHLAGDTLLPPSASPAGFTRCSGLELPEPLPVGATVKGCLLFLVPQGTAVESVDFQPGDVTTAVRWTP